MDNFNDSKALAIEIAKILDKKKAQDVRVLKVESLTVLTDYFVIASGTSTTQVSFTRIDSANIMLAQTPVFMGVPNVGVTDTFDGYSCVVPDAGSIAELLNTYFRSYTGPVSASELNLVTNDWPHGTASTSANVQFVGQLDKE